MAAGDSAILCVDPSISLEQLINSVLVETAAGVVGIRAVTITAAAADISTYRGCQGVNMHPEDAIRNAFGITATGETALILITET